MQHIISHMTSMDDLRAFRRYAASVLESHLGSPIKGRKLDELVAELAGASDWNTAVGMIHVAEARAKQSGNEGVRVTAESSPKPFEASWHSTLLGLVVEGYISEAHMDLTMDMAVDELVGTSQWISDNINNQGYEAQLAAIKDSGSAGQLSHRIATATGIPLATLKRCNLEAWQAIVRGELEPGMPFNVGSVLGPRT